MHFGPDLDKMRPRMQLVIGSKTRRLGLALAAVFFIVQFILLFIRHYDTMDLEVYPNTEPTPDFRSDFSVGQTFLARTNGLNRIDVLMGTHGRTLGQDVVFKLRESRDEPGLRSLTIKRETVRDNLYQTFSFPPIKDSKGRAFAFEISAAGGGTEGPGCLWMNARDIYPDGGILFGGNPGSGDCIFRTYASRTLASAAGRIAGRWPGVLGKAAFFWLMTLLFEISLLALLWNIPGLFFAGPAPAQDARRP